MMAFSVAVLVMSGILIVAVPVPKRSDTASLPVDSEDQLRSLTSKDNVVKPKTMETPQHTRIMKQQQKLNEVENVQQQKGIKMTQNDEGHHQQQERQQQELRQQLGQQQQQGEQELQQTPIQQQQQEQGEQDVQQSSTQQQRQTQQESQRQQQETQSLPTFSNAIVDDLVSKINDNIRSRHATMTLCRKVHGIYFKGKCIIAKDNIEMVIGSVFSDNLKQGSIPKESFVGFGNPDLLQG